MCTNIVDDLGDKPHSEGVTDLMLTLFAPSASSIMYMLCFSFLQPNLVIAHVEAVRLTLVTCRLAIK
jgi:hypothetical protein